MDTLHQVMNFIAVRRPGFIKQSHIADTGRRESPQAGEFGLKLSGNGFNGAAPPFPMPGVG